MTVFIATLVVKEGKEKEFEQLQTKLSIYTHENEPDAIVYDVIRHRDKPQTYIVYARFKDEEAFQYHQETDIHDKLVPPLLECLAEEMDLQFFDWVS